MTLYKLLRLYCYESEGMWDEETVGYFKAGTIPEFIWRKCLFPALLRGFVKK
jgi:hypothetical protein